MQATLSASSTVVQARDQVSSDLAGEVVILNLATGVYYGLDQVGARIWECIQEPKTVAEVRNAILEEYDVEVDRCERDLLSLLEKLAAAQLIEIDRTSAR